MAINLITYMYVIVYNTNSRISKTLVQTVASLRSRRTVWSLLPHKLRNQIINIRNESSSDVTAIESLTEATFREAPHSSHTEQFIVNALRKADKLSVSLVYELDGVVVGHVAVSPVSVQGNR